jgi:hypothetical protein
VTRLTARALALLAAGSLSACGGASSPSIGTTYDDPEGAYTIQVDPAWESHVGGFAEGVEVWLIGPPENGFRPNVNLLTQSVPGISLADYTAASIKSAPAQISDFTLITTSKVQPDLELMDYTGSAQGRPIHFLAIFGVHGDRAVIATLTAPTDSLAYWRATAEPYLRTLRLT